MLTFLYILAASVTVTLVSLISVGFLYVGDEKLKIWIPRLVAVAVGVLLGDAFLHLIPDALELNGSEGVRWFFGLGRHLEFLFIETVLQWRHDHEILKPMMRKRTRRLLQR